MNAFAVAVVGPERPSIEMHVIRRVVPVDVRVFENVGLGVEDTQMSECVAYYIKVLAPENPC